MPKKFTTAQQNEALTLVRVLASYDCANSDPERTCGDLKLSRNQMCGPCHAFNFVSSLAK